MGKRKVLFFLLMTFVLFTESTLKTNVSPNPCDIFGIVYVESDKKRADHTIYIEKSEAFADLVVYKEENKLLADGQGLWYFTDKRDFADFTVFIADKRSNVDFTIYYTETMAHAGCK